MSHVGEKNKSLRQLIKVLSKEFSELLQHVQEDQLISARLKSPLLEHERHLSCYWHQGAYYIVWYYLDQSVGLGCDKYIQ